ncbi:MAG: peptidylprolyl isomerase [Oscillospiraceae bacterium]|nr:peptidylprolyl isomerase [Oscillospiraceae bacterium]
MKVKNIILAILVVLIFIILEVIVMGYYQKTVEVVKNPIVTMEVEGYGTVKIELYPDQAPNTVANFIELINEGYYNGLTFHRVVPNALIQGGDKDGTGSGQVDFAIEGEFLANGFKQNTLRHEEGTISMARADYSQIDSSLTTQGYNSAGTQFFICVDTNKSWDGLYAAFGKVIEGMDIVKTLSNVPTTADANGDNTKPKKSIVITSMTVDTFGVDYGAPKRITPFDINSWYEQQYSSYDMNDIIIPGN